MSGNGSRTHQHRVRVRGIYATALTRLLLERGFLVVDASALLRQRLDLPLVQERPDVNLYDRYDRQGVIVEGQAEAAEVVVAALLADLPDPVLHRMDSPPGQTRLAFEFPATVKQALDVLREVVVPTLPGHHYLKTIESQRVDQAEQTLARDPTRASELARRLREDLVRRCYRRGMSLPIRHVKPDGRAYDLRGRFGCWRDGLLVLERRFRGGGAYDSLNLPKREGDYGLLEVCEGSWVSRRAYFRGDGTLLGELYNIGTPAELYPDHVRYLDLEVDVLHLPGGPPRVIDQDDLEEQLQAGNISPRLGEHATRLADEVHRALIEGRPNDVWDIS
jgi:hypothetical protein